MPEGVLDVKALKVRRPAFVNPHIGRIGGGDAVSEPLMPTLVDDNKIEFRADADSGPVAFEIPVCEVVPISDGALVLHAGIRHFNPLVAVFLERLFAEV